MLTTVFHVMFHLMSPIIKKKNKKLNTHLRSCNYMICPLNLFIIFLNF